MEKVNFKGGTLLSPLPVVMVSCGDMEKSNIITVAWTGILCSDPPKIYISVRPERYSYDIIKEKKEFVINLVNKRLVYATDYFGIKSGRNIDKFSHFSLTKEKSKEVKCPAIGESPLNIECKVTDIVKLGSHDMFIADIVSVNVDKMLIDDKGKIRLDKAKLVSYSHGEYFMLGEKLGKFGYTTKKKVAK